jgi:hypothetical protein
MYLQWQILLINARTDNSNWYKMKSFCKGLQRDILILEFLHLFTLVESSEENWCNFTDKSSREESKIDGVYLIYEGVKLRTKERWACFIFSCLCTTQILILNIFLSFYLPLFKSAAKKTTSR